MQQEFLKSEKYLFNNKEQLWDIEAQLLESISQPLNIERLQPNIEQLLLTFKLLSFVYNT